MGRFGGEAIRAELLLAEVAIHILVQMEEDVADALSIAPAEPALLGLFWVGLYSELHQLIPHGAHHYVPNAHPAYRRTHTHAHAFTADSRMHMCVEFLCIEWFQPSGTRTT